MLAYSHEIDEDLFDLVTIRRSAALSTDNSILRQQLLTLLTKYNITDLLKENTHSGILGCIVSLHDMEWFYEYVRQR